MAIPAEGFPATVYEQRDFVSEYAPLLAQKALMTNRTRPLQYEEVERERPGVAPKWFRNTLNSVQQNYENAVDNFVPLEHSRLNNQLSPQQAGEWRNLNNVQKSLGQNLLNQVSWANNVEDLRQKRDELLSQEDYRYSSRKNLNQAQFEDEILNGVDNAIRQGMDVSIVEGEQFFPFIPEALPGESQEEATSRYLKNNMDRFNPYRATQRMYTDPNTGTVYLSEDAYHSLAEPDLGLYNRNQRNRFSEALENIDIAKDSRAYTGEEDGFVFSNRQTYVPRNRLGFRLAQEIFDVPIYDANINNEGSLNLETMDSFRTTPLGDDIMRKLDMDSSAAIARGDVEIVDGNYRPTPQGAQKILDYATQQKVRQYGLSRSTSKRENKNINLNIGDIIKKSGATPLAELDSPSYIQGTPTARNGIAFPINKYRIPVVLPKGKKKSKDDKVITGESRKAWVDNIVKTGDEIFARIRYQTKNEKGENIWVENGIKMSPDQISSLEAALGLSREFTLSEYIDSVPKYYNSTNIDEEFSIPNLRGETVSTEESEIGILD